MRPLPKTKKENHTKIDGTIRDVIFGMEDGIVTALGTVLGVGAATADARIVIIAGIVALFSEAISMFFGSYLGTKSEKELIERTISEEKKEMRDMREVELNEMRAIYRKRGFTEKEIKILLNRLNKNDKLFLEEMLIHEFGIVPQKIENPFSTGIKFWLATMIGIITIVPFLFLPVQTAMYTAAALAMLTMFSAGALKTKYTKGNWLASGIEMMVVGLAAAVVGYALGTILNVAVSI